MDKDKDKGQPAKSWIYRRALLRCERARRSSVEWHPAVDDLVFFTKVEAFSKSTWKTLLTGRPGVFHRGLSFFEINMENIVNMTTW